MSGVAAPLPVRPPVQSAIATTPQPRVDTQQSCWGKTSMRAPVPGPSDSFPSSPLPMPSAFTELMKPGAVDSLPQTPATLAAYMHLGDCSGVEQMSGEILTIRKWSAWPSQYNTVMFGGLTLQDMHPNSHEKDMEQLRNLVLRTVDHKTGVRVFVEDLLQLAKGRTYPYKHLTAVTGIAAIQNILVQCGMDADIKLVKDRASAVSVPLPRNACACLPATEPPGCGS